MQQDTGIDPDSLRVLSMLSEKQRDCALTLYANREKKKSLAYVFWIVGAVYYFYLDRPAAEYRPLDPLVRHRRLRLVDRRPLPHRPHGRRTEQRSHRRMHA